MASIFASFINLFKKSVVEVQFSEILLNALSHVTDSEPIPYANEVDTLPASDNGNSSNVNTIHGCYWCGVNKVVLIEFQEICCSMKCLFTLHEWCIEKAEEFTEYKFCRLPGCNNSPELEGVCCSEEHKTKYYSLMSSVKIKNNLDSYLKRGPKWCDNEMNISNSHIHSLPQKEPLTPKMDIAIKMKEQLVFYTDVGPVPRVFKNEEHLSSQYSSSVNWNVGISGCYMCGEKVTDPAEYLCSKTCYYAFNEWCRQKILYITKFCKLPGCGLFADAGAVCCGKEHEKDISKCKINTGLVDKGPTWYQSNPNAEVQNSSQPFAKKKYHSQTKPINLNDSDLVFAETLTRYLCEQSDIGPIPRSLFPNFPDSCLKTNPVNSNVIVPGCYWCCKDNLSIHGVSCSEKCFFLLNEWCHGEYQKSTKKKLCKFPLCDSTPIYGKDCCKKEHFDKYRLKFTSRFSNELKSSEFALGPMWYTDTDRSSIDFYNVDEPFYEFTNFFPCTHLFIDNFQWSTSEHYFQSQKFVGTPHVEFVRRKDTPREAFDFTRHPNVQRWIRPDWVHVKVSVMLKALEAKFAQNDDLKDLLIRTGNRKIFEHTRNDSFWGDGGDRTGKNVLGELLMQVRFSLQSRVPYFPATLKHFTHADFSQTHQFKQHTSDSDDLNTIPEGVESNSLCRTIPERTFLNDLVKHLKSNNCLKFPPDTPDITENPVCSTDL